MTKATLIDNDKQLKNPLSEVCDLQGVQYAAYLLGKVANETFINLNKEIDPPFEIAETTIPEVYRLFGGEVVLRYIYDWAYDELDRQAELEDNESSEYDETVAIELSLFLEKLENNGGLRTVD